MTRPRQLRDIKVIQLRVPEEWYEVLTRHAVANSTNVSEVIRPHIKKVVDAITTMKAA